MDKLKELKEFLEQNGKCDSEYITELILENEKFDYLNSEILNGQKISNDMISLEWDGYLTTLNEFLSDYNDGFIDVILKLIDSFIKEEESDG